MKVIKIGSASMPWWVGRKICCVCCGLTIRLEVNDPVSSYLVKGIDPHQKYVVVCPACGTEAAFREKKRGVLKTEYYYKI